MPLTSSRAALLAALLFLAALLGFAAMPERAARAADRASPRWTAATPDIIIDRAVQAASAAGPDALARVLFIASLADEASAGKAVRALEQVAAGAARSGDLADQARWLARAIAPEARQRAADALLVQGPTDEGMIRTFSVLGPFEDNGGGLARAQGPETAGHDYRRADYSWGAFEVRPVRSLVGSATAAGLPLDLYIHPRSESCSYLSSAITVPAAERIVVHVASTGAFRLRWDGHDAVSDPAHHRLLRVDRAAVAVDAPAGSHLIELKVCSGAVADEGRVRVRLTGAGGKPLAVGTSSEPAELQAALERAKKAPPAKFELEQTALQTALALGAGPLALDAALGAATVRVLAGADDLQSPRAPGLLDVIANAPDATADVLAVVGYLAPFGANRSGWLERAQDLAKSAHDEQALAFAQRALTLTRVGSGQIDLAQAMVAEPPLSQARDPQAELIKSEVLARLGNAGLRSKALDRLEEAQKQAGPAAPEALWRAIGQYAQGARPSTHLRAMQRLNEIANGYGGAALAAANRMLGADAVARVALAELGHAHDARDLDQLGELLLDLGRYREARAVYDLSAGLSPNRASAHEGLARALEAQAAGAEGIAAELARARALDPRSSALAAEIAFRQGKRSGADLGPDAPFLVAPEVFLARAKNNPAPKQGLFERQLHWRRIVRLHPDMRISQTIHYAREILVEPRTEQERYERAPFAGRGSELLIARVHRPDGTVLLPEEQDETGATLRWPKLRRGDVVEVAVRFFTAGPVGRRGDAPFYFIDYVGSVQTRPVLYNEVVVDAPEGSALAFDVVGGKPDKRVTDRVGGRAITYLIWDHPPAIADEPLAPPPSETMPVVVGSVYPSWKDFLGWYKGAVAGFTEPDEQIKKLAAELTKGKTARQEKIEALFDYVADDIRYVNYTSDEWWLPNRPQVLLARRQGDCDDKANLLISLLGAVGIDATEALVQTRYTGEPRILLGSKIAVPMFDHGIVWLPDDNGKGGRFLDATSPQSRMPVPPAMDDRAVALLLDGDAPIATPRSSAADHGMTAEWKLTLAADGGAKLAATERHVGDSAFFLRMNLRQADARAQYVEANLLSRWLTAVKLDREVRFDGDQPGGEASLQYSGSSAALARHEGTDLIVALAPPVPITAQLAPLKKRTLPVALPPYLAPNHRDMTITIALPKGYQAAALPPDDDLPAGEFGSAKQSFELSRDRRQVIIKRELAFDASRIEVADYARWRAWLRDVDRMMQRAVRLVKKG